MARFFPIFQTVLRVLIGLIFIVSAIFKLLSLENFEIYIYSFKWFGFVFSGIVARCVIAAELLLGAFLISKILYKPTWWLIMAMLLGFSLLMVYVALFRHDDNCHCLGDIVELSPGWTIVKNIVLMALMLLIRKEKDYHFRGKKALGISLTVAAVAVPFALFPMDSVYKVFSREELKLDEAKFDAFMQDSVAQSLDLDQGNYILGYLASGCKYCKISANKLHQIVQQNALDSTRVIFFIWGSEESKEKFREETKTGGYRYAAINPIEALNIVYGQFPTYVYLKDGKVEKVADLKNLEEHYTVSFLNEKR